MLPSKHILMTGMEPKTWSACQFAHFALVVSEVHGSQIQIPSCVRVTHVTVQM